jgi:hypothetical protein
MDINCHPPKQADDTVAAKLCKISEIVPQERLNTGKLIDTGACADYPLACWF